MVFLWISSKKQPFIHFFLWINGCFRFPYVYNVSERNPQIFLYGIPCGHSAALSILGVLLHALHNFMIYIVLYAARHEIFPVARTVWTLLYRVRRTSHDLQLRKELYLLCRWAYIVMLQIVFLWIAVCAILVLRRLIRNEPDPYIDDFFIRRMRAVYPACILRIHIV